MKNIIIFLSASLFLIACGKSSPEEVKETVSTEPETSVTLTTAQYKAANIAFGKITQKNISTSIQVNGKLDVPPQNLVTIAAPMGGFVKSALLLPGMSVRKGDVVATLQNQEYIQIQQDYLDSKSQLEFLEAEYHRQEELAKENINAQKSLQQAKSHFESMQAKTKGLEVKLAMINIAASSLVAGNIRSTINLLAPIDGFISEANVTTGQYVNATDVMLRIVNPDHIHAELQVYEKDLSKISIGQRVTFKLVNGTNTYGASVLLIGKEISPEHTIIIHCHLDKEEKNLLPGMFVTANIETESASLDVLPQNTIMTFEGEHIVFVKDGDQTFKMVPVKPGQVSDDFTAVEFPEGFDKTSDIVFTGAFELLGVLKNTEEEE